MDDTSHSLKPWVIFAGCVLVIVVLYWAQAVLVPIALAVLLTFVLTPPVSWLERWLGRVPAVLAAVTLVRPISKQFPTFQFLGIDERQHVMSVCCLGLLKFCGRWRALADHVPEMSLGDCTAAFAATAERPSRHTASSRRDMAPPTTTTNGK
jgi:hypothetical protein